MRTKSIITRKFLAQRQYLEMAPVTQKTRNTINMKLAHNSQFNEVVVKYFRNGCGHIEQLQFGAIVGQHAELLDEELCLGETRLVKVVDEVFRQSSQRLEGRR